MYTLYWVVKRYVVNQELTIQQSFTRQVVKNKARP